MLNNQQKKFLKKQAHRLSPVFQIGKNGENKQQITTILDYLSIYELVKVKVLNNAPNDIAYYVVMFEAQGIEVINQIGRNITLYKYSNNDKKKTTWSL